MKKVKVWQVNGISIIAPTVDIAIQLWRDHRAQIERKDLQCYEQIKEEIDILEAKYIQSVWLS